MKKKKKNRIGDCGIDVSGTASVSISSGSFGMNTAKSNGRIFGSELWMTSKEYYYTKINLNTLVQIVINCFMVCVLFVIYKNNSEAVAL